MKNRRFTRSLVVFALLAWSATLSWAATPLGTPFTYQGKRTVGIWTRAGNNGFLLNASKIHLQTASGVQVWRKLPLTP